MKSVLHLLFDYKAEQPETVWLKNTTPEKVKSESRSIEVEKEGIILKKLQKQKTILHARAEQRLLHALFLLQECVRMCRACPSLFTNM